LSHKIPSANKPCFDFALKVSSFPVEKFVAVVEAYQRELGVRVQGHDHQTHFSDISAVAYASKDKGKD